MSRSGTDYFLVLDAIDNDVIADIRLHSESELCAELRICFEGAVQMRAAPAGELSIGSKVIGGLVGTSGYYLHTVDPGPYVWVVSPRQDKSLPYPTATLKFDCEDQQAAYLRYSNGMWFNKIKIVNARRGQKDIRARWLAVSTTASDDIIHSDSTGSSWLRGEQI